MSNSFIVVLEKFDFQNDKVIIDEVHETDCFIDALENTYVDCSTSSLILNSNSERVIAITENEDGRVAIAFPASRNLDVVGKELDIARDLVTEEYDWQNASHFIKSNILHTLSVDRGHDKTTYTKQLGNDVYSLTVSKDYELWMKNNEEHRGYAEPSFTNYKTGEKRYCNDGMKGNVPE